MMKLETILAIFGTATLMAQSYFIKGPGSPKPHETTAIQEMTDYLARRIGDNGLTIGGRDKVTFQIGDTALAREQNCLSTQLEDEKWVIRSVGDQVLINGGGQHGTLYATYHFLEDYCDIHWWSDFEDYVPTASSLELPALDVSGKPYFQYRNIHRGPDWSSEMTAMRNRLSANGAHVKSSKAVGGSVDYGRPDWAHTHAKYIPEEEFFADHPEYFALVGGSRRPGKDGQLCLSNPDLVQIFADKMCKFIEQDRAEAARNDVPYPKFYEVSQNDNTAACKCEKCSEYVQKYGYSTQNIEFLNAISRIVTPKYPDIYISSLAYHYTDEPPKKDIRTEKNVVIRLCDTKTNQAISILHPDNQKFKSFVEAWKSHTENLSIWDYAVNYERHVIGMPFASEFYYGDLYKFYKENNVTGFFWEHEYEYKADMFEYKFFLECKLLEDPDADIRKLQDLFLSRYYGPAAKHILAYRNVVDRALKEHNGFIPFWSASQFNFDFIKNDDIVEIEEIFKDAEAAVAGDELLLSRVRRARLGMDRLIAQRYIVSSHGIMRGLPVLDKSDALKRLDTDWRKWLKRYPASYAKAYDREVTAFLEQVAQREKLNDAPVPAKFKDNSFYFFQPAEFRLFSKHNKKIVDDSECTAGKAARVNSDASHYYRLPFEMGCYDTVLKKNLKKYTSDEVPKGPGYTWLNMGKVTLTDNCDLYFTRDWTIQIPVSDAALRGQTFDIWAEMKFTGPLYHADETGIENHIYLGMVVLVKVQD